MSNSSTICFILIILYVSGCANTTNIRRSETEQKAISLQSRALRAAEKQEYKEAERLFSDALASYTSIENNQQKALILINLARLNRQNNNIIRAEFFLKKALSIDSKDDTIIAETYYEKSLIEVASGKPQDALLSARKSFAAEKGIYKGKRQNLIARALYENGDMYTAQTEALAALHENHEQNLLEEEANSLYIVATIEREQKHIRESRQHYQEALIIDKKLGIPHKISRDLVGLAEAAIADNMTKEAVMYMERAIEIYGATGQAQKAQALLEKVQKLTTNPSSNP